MNAPVNENAGETHEVFNVSTELADYNLFTTDQPLMEATAREGAGNRLDNIADFGQQIGQAAYLELGHLANRYKPELDTHDRFGHRIDLVRYHDAYHRLMGSALENGLHASPWSQPGPGAHVTRAAKYLMHYQVEAGHACPITMTFASIPTIRLQPEVAAIWEPKILGCGYDPRNIPGEQKSAITVGMGMTEKQGGSDVRANTTTARPVAAAGGGQMYQLTGHKWFLSAPMCDLFLILAQTETGLSCFLVPRWLPDGSKNALQVIRLKEKMGNQSNASSEIELRGAQGWLIGEQGRGVATIIEMVSMTRFDCIAGSVGLMHMATAQAIHHCTQRAAFGAKLIDQPLMQNVLADMALEYEGAIALAMRMAGSLDRRDGSDPEAMLLRLGLPVGKYWVCKRAPALVYEAMECIGGSGVMENCMMPRLFRESVINPIWEGSGNVQCLDMLRAIAREPASMEAYLQEAGSARGGNAIFDRALQQLTGELGALPAQDAAQTQFGARHLADRMALVLQASLLVRHAPDAVSEAFCASRLGAAGQHAFGTLPAGTDTALIIERASPAVTHSPQQVARVA